MLFSDNILGEPPSRLGFSSSAVFQLQKLESDLMPMQQANSELSEKSGMLQAEKKILEEEIKRWKARTQVSETTKLIVRPTGEIYHSPLEKHLISLNKILRQVIFSLPLNPLFVLLAFGESTERFRPRGIQASAL